MIEVVCAVIEDADGRVLACRRPADKHLGGLWEFPGGKIDPGERPTEALLREVREELGIAVEILAPLTPVVWHYECRTIRLHPFRCRLTTGEPQPLEHEEITWCGLQDIITDQWAAADVPVIRELLELAPQ